MGPLLCFGGCHCKVTLSFVTSSVWIVRSLGGETDGAGIVELKSDIDQEDSLRPLNKYNEKKKF